MSDLQILGVDPSLPSKEEEKNDTTQGESKDISSTARDDQFTGGHDTPEIATNDGSVIETLDTALHGKPGWSEGENISGSNRTDYYEARSYGKSDVEEELDDLRERNKQTPGKKV
ncbi:MAG: hypothetical protein ACXWCG_00065 [Flavitalea sp.]